MSLPSTKEVASRQYWIQRQVDVCDVTCVFVTTLSVSGSDPCWSLCDTANYWSHSEGVHCKKIILTVEDTNYEVSALWQTPASRLAKSITGCWGLFEEIWCIGSLINCWSWSILLTNTALFKWHYFVARKHCCLKENANYSKMRLEVMDMRTYWHCWRAQVPREEWHDSWSLMKLLSLWRI